LDAWIDLEYRPDDDFDHKALIKLQKEQEGKERVMRQNPELYKEFNRDDKETIEFEEISLKNLLGEVSLQLY
jgi:hypothetical protein